MNYERKLEAGLQVNISISEAFAQVNFGSCSVRHHMSGDYTLKEHASRGKVTNPVTAKHVRLLSGVPKQYQTSGQDVHLQFSAPLAGNRAAYVIMSEMAHQQEDNHADFPLQDLGQDSAEGSQISVLRRVSLHHPLCSGHYLW
ncbi:uncharacterized protein LOC110837215 isoform X1 [Zootermopsis nevadensis]|uniref:uncharacterized protein LOC110837215 isoform X1 n=1 Tax=Zootermopsis nevadensis TaxID=136037 RepID=UPI000B8EBAB1|nr:uncharacterized protein LOC110837215 isoform X1 [Zootermopsis nevadensis]